MTINDYKSLLRYGLEKLDQQQVIDELVEAKITILGICAKFDDAASRIHDMQAELEHLRREVNRG